MKSRARHQHIGISQVEPIGSEIGVCVIVKVNSINLPIHNLAEPYFATYCIKNAFFVQKTCLIEEKVVDLQQE